MDKEFIKRLGLGNQNRLRFRIRTRKGEIVDVVVQYEAMIQGKWRCVVRYDCCHGFAHRDIHHPTGEQDKYALNLDSLEQVLQYAEQDLNDRWQWYRSRYEQELKRK